MDSDKNDNSYEDNNNNNNNNNNHNYIYSAIIIAVPLREFTRFTRWKQKRRQVAADLWTKPTGFSRRPAYIGNQQTVPTIAIYYYNSVRKPILILPSRGG